MVHSMRNRDVPTEICATNRHKCIEYIPRGYCTILLLYVFPPGRVCWQRYVPSDQCDVSSQVSFISIFYSRFTINFYLQVNSDKFIVKPPMESYDIYLRSFLPFYIKLPYKTLYLRVLLVAGGGTSGRPRLRLSPIPFPSALLSLLIMQPPFNIH